MSDRLKEMRDKRGKLVKDARAILEAAEAEKRELTGEEKTKWDGMFAEQEKLGVSIKTEERQIEAEREMASRVAPTGASESREDASKTPGPRGTPEYRAAFRDYLTSGVANRALEATAGPSGGYTVAPEQFVANLIRFVNDQVFIRAKATKYQVAKADKLGAPSLEADPADADWTTELATGGEDSTMALGKRELAPSPVAKLLKVSKKLLRASVLDIEGLVMERLGYKFSITQEKAFMTGSGVNQPLGLFTASNSGIPTSRDVSTGNATTAMTFDGLINAKYSLKGAYWPRSEWIFHRDGVKQIATLKDGDGQYIWQPQKTAGDPDMLLGRPVNMSEYAPNTFTSQLYVGLFGDFTQYWIVDALDMTVQVLQELYAATNQTGFIGRMESDGMPVLAEAFARVKLA